MDTISSHSSDYEDTQKSVTTKIFTNLEDYASYQLKKENKSEKENYSEFYEKAIQKVGENLKAAGITHEKLIKEKENKNKPLVNTIMVKKALKKADPIEQTNQIF